MIRSSGGTAAGGGDSVRRAVLDTDRLSNILSVACIIDIIILPYPAAAMG
jgi:hypothetical protein